MYIADLHIHSKYSRATSKEGDILHLDLWARRKGIALVGTGDFTHPAWRDEMAELLEPAEEGLYRVKKDKQLHDVCDFPLVPRFVISGEISCIYKQDGRVRKVHNVILLPSLDAAERLSLKLETIGNIRSDGRPILGISSKDLLAATLEVCPEAIFIPAHIWTPHFSLFGAFSGFDTLDECFGDLSPHIRALETGLSSDPLMNRRVPMLDRYTMVSNSDAHSPQKLGRECNLLDTEISYPALKRALDTGEGFAGTVEFFPEEGKYHLDGHRNCNLCLTPAETRALGGRCPVCGKKITIGVLNRLEQLAERNENYIPQGAKPFEHLMPLPEVISASFGVSATGNKAERTYNDLLNKLGSEMAILRERSLSDIRAAGGERIAEGIARLRAGRVIKTAGYDGEYGKIALFTPDELKNASGQLSFFDSLPLAVTEAPTPKPLSTKKQPQQEEPDASAPRTINPEQLEAAESGARIIAVIAGPGTGKTFTLTERIARLVQSGVNPEKIAAVTFTVRAAQEMRERLAAKLKKSANKIAVGTFHSLCYDKLKDKFSLADRAFSLKTAEAVAADFALKISPRRLLNEISLYKNGKSSEYEREALEYTRRLREAGTLDFDDLISEALAQDSCPGFRYLHVDEFQDVNDAQYRLLQKWLYEDGSLFAIGDPDQAIYSFRGAASDCFSRLARDYPQAEVIRLRQNYRSTPQILRCAADAIAPNIGEHALSPVRTAGEAVRLVRCDSELAEGIFVAKEIARMTGGLQMHTRGREDKLRSFGEIAVLARTNRQLAAIEHCLRHDDIPCTDAGKTDFLDAPEVSGTISFFASLAENNEAPAVLEFLGGKFNFENLKQEFATQLNERPRKILEKWRTRLSIHSESFERLIRAAHYAEMSEFLQAMRLGREGDISVDSQTARAGAVRLYTLHGAKGLEFPVVFLCGLSKGVLPLTSAGEIDEAEERRLFYVGITRAKDELIITARGEESAFLADIYASVQAERALHRPQYEQLSLF